MATVTLNDCVQAVLDAADRVGWEQFVLLGHSLGGVTVTETAYRHPERIGQLIYVGALIPALHQSASLTQSGVDWPAGLDVTIEEPVARAIFGNDLDNEEWAAAWNEFVPDAERLFNARLSGYPNGLPITYIGMADDIAVPPALADQMIANLPGSVERRVLPGGHLPMVSRPRELAATINDVVGGGRAAS